MAAIKMVTGDRNPSWIIQLQDENTGEAVDLTDPNLLVKVRFRANGAAATLWEATCTKVTGGETAGQAQLDWAADALEYDEGYYELEVYLVDASSKRETCFRKVRIRLRERFADAS